MRCARIADSARIVLPCAARAIEIGEDEIFDVRNFSEGKVQYPMSAKTLEVDHTGMEGKSGDGEKL